MAYSAGVCLMSAIGTMSVLSCSTTEERPVRKKIIPVSVIDTIEVTPKIEEPKRLELSYRLDSLNSKTQLDSFRTKYSESQRKIIYALNRIDPGRVRLKRPLVVPDTLTEDLLAYSPFPKRLDILDSVPQTVLIAQRIQAFALYENGKLLRWGPVSSGKHSTTTPDGLYYGNYKAKRKVSTVDDSWIMPYYFNFMNHEGIGTHQYTLPGYPASHGCIRMYREDAKFIYNWAQMWKLNHNNIQNNGTPFMVVGKYNFDEDKPWQKLTENMKATDLNDEELEIIQNYVDQYKNDPRNFKDEKEEEEAPETIT